MTNAEQIAKGLSEAQKQWVLLTPERRITTPVDAVAAWQDIPDLYVTIDGFDVYFGEASLVGFETITEVLNKVGLQVRDRLKEMK